MSVYEACCLIASWILMPGGKTPAMMSYRELEMLHKQLKSMDAEVTLRMGEIDYLEHL
jgi:hypothetical protein